MNTPIYTHNSNDPVKLGNSYRLQDETVIVVSEIPRKAQWYRQVDNSWVNADIQQDILQCGPNIENWWNYVEDDAHRQRINRNLQTNNNVFALTLLKWILPEENEWGECAP